MGWDGVSWAYFSVSLESRSKLIYLHSKGDPDLSRFGADP